MRSGIAIIGMSGRFPGASGIGEFWRNLCDGVESITRFDESELEDTFPPAIRRSPEFVPARAILPDVDKFDAGFFGITARDAELTDPQHRLFLECCWEALEDSGHVPGQQGDTIGVVAGCTINSYVLRQVLGDRAAVERFTEEYQVGSYAELLGAGQDFLATRVAYRLDLRGPAMTLQSACSTSLLAVAQACNMLEMRQAETMLAGAVSISFPQRRGYVHQAGGMVSADGHCRPFDSASSGTVFGDGVGVVVLKRLEDAVAEGDAIYAVIRGIGVNNDGAAKAGFTAPSSAGQTAAISAAHTMSGFDARSIRYVECHGTATPLGDPIEFAALCKAFPAGIDGAYCTLGSVKANIGHLDVAAGMSGLIKTVLTVQRGKIPPLLHFSQPNPRIPLAGSPFQINTELLDWPSGDTPRRAAVSSFGVGGTNVHLVLEQAPSKPRLPVAEERRQLFVISGRSQAALEASGKRLADYLRNNPEVPISDVAFTLQVGRRGFAYRSAFSAFHPSEAIAALEHGIAARHVDAEPAIAFLFPGQGAQYLGMGHDLYRCSTIFRDAFDHCASVLERSIGENLSVLLYRSGPEMTDLARLDQTAFAQPALFCVEYALAQMWIQFGIVPSAVLGHSVGEFVAATLAGVFRLDDALSIIAERGRIMQALPSGAMLAVRLSEAELTTLLTPGLDLAAANSPKLSVASGSLDAIRVLERKLGVDSVACRRLAATHAFHSSMMDAALAPLLERFQAIELRTPQIPYVSGISGDWITDEQATSPEYWARHCRETVRFSAAVETIVAGGNNVLLEVGPGSALRVSARQTLHSSADYSLIGSLSDPTDSANSDEYSAIVESIGKLWCLGATPNWQAVHAPTTPHRVSLPTYPFERRRYWVDALDRSPALAAPAPRLETNPLPQQSPAHPSSTQIIDSGQSDSTKNVDHFQIRNEEIESALCQLLEELSGESVTLRDRETSFLELGFDSLFLGRFVQKLGQKYQSSVTFRALTSEIPTVAALAKYIAANRPASIDIPIGVPEAVQHTETVPISPAGASKGLTALTAQQNEPGLRAVHSLGMESVVREQLAVMQQLMREQLQAMQGLIASGQVGNPIAQEAVTLPPVSASTAQAVSSEVSSQGAASSHVASASTLGTEPPSRFDVYRPGTAASRGELTSAQHQHIADLVDRTVRRTARSKELTARYRPILADPRVAAGFRAEWKEMVYPIVCDRAKGSRLWDVDGNEYIDILNGFGQTAFGHSPDFVVEALSAQLREGFPIGPQTALAGEAAKLFCELTGNERVTFCNTGSEAVMAALRVARTVTGRDRVVMFSGAYHGQFDEVLVKAARTSQRAIPVAPGIPGQSVANMVVLPYADKESLNWVREHAGELAAVLVEPVQSRHPDLAPKEFLSEIRAITQASGTAFVIDEVVTGFRIHPGGMQAVFGIRADLATYGKVVGGGMPIGILAGTARFMDALDGGAWQYGDDSGPEVPPTFFAGTFVRHPLVMSAVLAVLRHLQSHGPELQRELSIRTAGLVARLNGELAARGIHTRIEHYGSLFYFNAAAEERLASLLYYHLRLRGIYIQEGFPCFLTTAHTSADCDLIVKAFAETLDELQSVEIFGKPQREIALVEQQMEIWLAAQMSDEASCAFNESITMRIYGRFDESAFEYAWSTIFARHDALRVQFHRTGEHMRIASYSTLVFAREDLATLGDREVQEKVDAIVAADAATPFDLVAGPLIRGRILKLGDEQHVVIVTAHHIVCDGWSFNVILGEFSELYAAACAGVPARLKEPLAFSKYAQSRHARSSDELARVEGFWLNVFSEPVAALNLPADRPRPTIRSFRGNTRSGHIDVQRYRAVKKAGAREGCTLFVTLLSGFAALMGRLAATRDVVIGVPAAGQALLSDEVLVGHCVDLLPMRVRWSPTTTLSELLISTKATVLAAYEHQDYTLGSLVRSLAPAREMNRVPLAEVQFNLERLSESAELPEIKLQTSPNPKAFVNFDVFFNVIESDTGLRIDCDYNTDLFDAATIDHWLYLYGLLLDSFTESSAGVVDELRIGASAAIPNAPASDYVVDPYPQHATISSLVEERAAQCPDAIAAICGEIKLSFAELTTLSGALAHELQHKFGTSGGRVAICMPRSIEMLVALLATLKAGFAYVPLDPTHPEERLRYILSDADVLAVITDAESDSSFLVADIPRIRVPGYREGLANEPVLRSSQLDPDSLAYAIYTSGSTGRPKGVEVTHRSVVNFLTSMTQTPGFSSTDTLLAVTTIAFDIAALELYLPLISGGTVVIAQEEEVRNGSLLLERLTRTQATVLQATPSTWRMLLETDFRPGAGFKMLCGGEPLRRDLADRLLGLGGELWNMYGPTETTIWSSCGRVGVNGTITVGRPIANTAFHILNEHDRPVSPGEAGQLHIGGLGVALGYVNREGLTAEKFIPNPFGSGRLYRTGDIARLTATNEFEVLGRTDQQVKLRGFRIELGEIEGILTSHDAISAAAVVLDPDQQRLVAYYVERKDVPIGLEELQTIARKQLPEYMIPAVWVKLDDLPLNSNGKIDRASLPPAPAGESGVAFASPQTPTERALAEIWADVLLRERVSVDDDIFNLGADSIQIFQITARANRRGFPVLAKHVMKHRTIAALAQTIDSSDKALATAAPRFPGRRTSVAVGGERPYVTLP